LVSGRSTRHTEADFLPFPDGQGSRDGRCLKRSFLNCVSIRNVAIVQDAPLVTLRDNHILG
jgi:hypothetical protein